MFPAQSAAASSFVPGQRGDPPPHFEAALAVTLPLGTGWLFLFSRADFMLRKQNPNKT